ncbi:MAG: HTH-type transcriptional regulator CysB, partial [Gammaproteobacteria bacterium]|nr:HTH-type transcriptional regulator CysB [Gammaproteobacteria bacterium]
IIASMAYDEQTDSDLVAIDASNLFRPSTTYIGCRKGTFLRKFMIDFINFFAPHLSHDLIREAFATTNNAARDALFADIELPAK